MQSFPRISLYTVGIICLYVILFPLFFIFTPNVFQYHFSNAQSGQVLIIISGTFLLFYVLNSFFHFRTLKWQNLRFFQIIVLVFYALFFAIPEEILFRGILQATLQNFVHNIFAVVIVSSVVFGLAHLPNGARGLSIKNWNWRFAAFAFFGGLPLTLIFAITNSLLIPTLLHAFFLIFFRLFTYERFDHTGLVEADR